MEDNNPQLANPFRHAMRTGLVLGAIIILLFVCMTIPHVLTSVATPFLMGTIIWLTYRYAGDYRDTECNGVITYGQALSYILILYFFAALVAGVLRYGYLEFINTTYLTDAFNQSMLLFEQMQKDMPTELVEAMRYALTPIRFTMQFIMFDCMMGLFIGLITAVFVRKNESLEG